MLSIVMAPRKKTFTDELEYVCCGNLHQYSAACLHFCSLGGGKLWEVLVLSVKYGSATEEADGGSAIDGGDVICFYSHHTPRPLSLRIACPLHSVVHESFRTCVRSLSRQNSTVPSQNYKESPSERPLQHGQERIPLG